MRRSLPALLVLLPAISARVAKPAVREITSEAEFDAQIVSTKMHSLVEFIAPWCEACKTFAPTLMAAAADIRRDRNDLQLLRVDGDTHVGLRTRYRVLEAPGVLLVPAASSANDASSAVRYDGPLEQTAVLKWARRELARFPAVDDRRRVPESLSEAPKRSQPQPASDPPSPPDRLASVGSMPKTLEPSFSSARLSDYLHAHAEAFLSLLERPSANVTGAPAAAADAERSSEIDEIDSEIISLLRRRIALHNAGRMDEGAGTGGTTSVQIGARGAPVLAAADSVGEHRHVGPRRADSAAKQKEAKQKEARQKEAKQIEARQKEAKRQEAKRQEAKRQEAKGRAAASRPATLEPAPVRPAPGLSSRASSQRTPPPHTSSQLEEPSRSSALEAELDRLLGTRSPLHASPDDHLDALDIGLGLHAY